MFKTMKQLFTHENKDLRKRIYFTLLCLTIFILGTSIRVPGTKNLSHQLGFLELLNTMGGGALKKLLNLCIRSYAIHLCSNYDATITNGYHSILL